MISAYNLCPISTIPLPFPFAVAVSVHRCRCCCVSFCRLRLQRNGIFLRNFYRTTEFYNGRTAKWQRKNGNGMMEIGHQFIKLNARGFAKD